MADMSEREMKSEFGGGSLIPGDATNPAFSSAALWGWFLCVSGFHRHSLFLDSADLQGGVTA
jgi:hypothetical protein